MINAVYYSELVGKVRDVSRPKSRKAPMRSVLLLQITTSNVIYTAAAVTQDKLEDLHRTGLDYLRVVQIYHHVIFICLEP